MSSSRSEYVAKNVSITLAMQIVKNLLGFVNRTVLYIFLEQNIWVLIAYLPIF